MFLLLCTTAKSQLISYQKIDSLSITEVNDIINNFGAPPGILVPQYSIDVYRVMYNTEYKGSFTEVSGLLVVPVNPMCKPPLVSYQHGTTSSKLNVPSYDAREQDIALVFASEGKVVVAPDHIGLGASTVNIHPYVHGFSQAHSTINLLRAARQLQDTLGFQLNNQLYLFGYSQGGYSTAVTQKYIETMYSNEFTVTASAPMSGPYNLAGAQTDYVNSGQPYATPGYLPYIIFGYQSVYEDLYDSIPQIFRAPYDTLLFPLFDGHNVSIGYINNVCDAMPINMFTATAENEFLNNPNYPFRRYLQENDLLSWVPQSPVRMYYCTQDEQVYYKNATIADSVWNANGAPNVSSENLDQFANLLGGVPNHGGCVAPALLSARGFFAEFDNQGVEILVNYNQTNDQLVVDVLNENVSDFTIEWNDGTVGNVLNSPVNGTTYTVTATKTATSCTNMRSFTLNDIVNSINNNWLKEKLLVTPNPSNGVFKIELPSNEQIQLIKVFSLSGQEVYKSQLSENTINLSEYQSGVYMVNVYTKRGVHRQSVVLSKY